MVITLREDEEEGQFFTIFGEPETGDPLSIQGQFDTDEGEITFSPGQSSPVTTPIELDFRRIDGSILELSSEDEGRTEERFLELIQFQTQGSVDRLVVGLSMADAPA